MKAEQLAVLGKGMEGMEQDIFDWAIKKTLFKKVTFELRPKYQEIQACKDLEAEFHCRRKQVV